MPEGEELWLLARSSVKVRDLCHAPTRMPLCAFQVAAVAKLTGVDIDVIETTGDKAPVSPMFGKVSGRPPR